MTEEQRKACDEARERCMKALEAKRKLDKEIAGDDYEKIKETVQTFGQNGCMGKSVFSMRYGMTVAR